MTKENPTSSVLLFQVDAFTDQPFRGNPAAVCVLDSPRDDQWMQHLAAEMNLSETAFIQPREDGFGLRWFTPTIEVPLCGHATLASAHVIWEEGYTSKNDPIHFHTKSGLLIATPKENHIELDFPKTEEQASPPPPGLVESLGIPTQYIGRNIYDYLVEVDSESTLRSMQPDFANLAQLDIRGVIVTAGSSSPEFDFVSRFFAPGAGINEDPVTGSAHCCLGPYWQKKLGKSEFQAYQASQRGGIVHVRVTEDRVFIAGPAVMVFRGQLASGILG